MLVRLIAARRLPQILGVRYSSSGRFEGSVAQSREFGKKEKAHEDEFIRRHEREQIRKLQEQIEKTQAQLDSLKKDHAELAEKVPGSK